MKFVKEMFLKHWPFFLFIILIAGLYLFRLSSFPIFADEAIYTLWAKRIFTGDYSPFISLYDGKPPLFIWSTIVVHALGLPILLAGRFVSVFSLLASLVVIYLFFVRRKQREQGIIAGVLISLSPFIFFHSRLAIIDALVSFLLLCSVIVSLELFEGKFESEIFSKFLSKKNIFLKNISVKMMNNGFLVILMGILSGLSFWSKPSALFLIPFLVGLIFLTQYKNLKLFLGFCVLFGVSFLATVFPLSLSIWFRSLFSRATDFSYPLTSLFTGQVSQILPNAYQLILWLGFYIHWGMLLLVLCTLVWAVYKKQYVVLLWLLSALIYILPIILLGKVIASRYYLFVGLILPVVVSYFLIQFPKILRYGLISFYCLWAIGVQYQGWLDPLKTYLPHSDSVQYLQEWSAGLGILEVGQKVREQASKGRLLVLTEGYFGSLPDGLFIMLDPITQKDNFEVVGVGSASSANFDKEIMNKKADFIWYVGNENRMSEFQFKYLHPLYRFAKLEGAPNLLISELNVEEYKKWVEGEKRGEN